MQQDILNDATFERELEDMKAKGTLQEFTAREVWKQRRTISKLPCLKEDCEFRSAIPKKALVGASGLTGAIFVIGDYVLRRLFGG